MNENYNTLTKFSKNLIPFETWEFLIDEDVPNEEHIGKRVWLAGTSYQFYYELKKVHKKGDPMWKDFDGFTLIEDNGFTKCVETECVRLHPLTLRMLNRNKEYDLKDEMLNPYDDVPGV